LRERMRAQRLALPAVERMRAAEAIVAPLLQLPEFQAPGYVAGYWATAGELPLHVLQLRLPAGVVWCLPCIQPDDSLRFAPWRPGDALVSNRFGIPEPDMGPDAQLDAADMALVLLPLLAFSRTGQRLGMGGGFYDRTLAFRGDSGAPPRLVGVAYSAQELPSWIGEHWDVGLDAIATERGLLMPGAGAAGQANPDLDADDTNASPTDRA
jgi:5-formyltetrahydrofolate cyclo-ligase